MTGTGEAEASRYQPRERCTSGTIATGASVMHETGSGALRSEWVSVFQKCYEDDPDAPIG